ncbi:6,7-dimethyl-8-ribityllumazine synthase [Phenylobacterium sp. J426]|uniref:6,7-dimethyl-8-ribityllumazine synthase n=1 Tax=Phenylobacterium sp. J426 TaxID=2898439 RepID=UPI002150F9D4|nr:6,7-dimethyl-8-ribityllumazine synthase [Phenylobacterium sp. J426]MCR5876015.1 6,7-dimethyl-8-ribityllumazine synthase [Phenylobacterium sp. J426]
MTQATPLAALQEFRTANGAFRAGRVAFVHALWHEEIVREAYAGFVDEIVSLGFPESAVERFETPGSFEIPLHAQTLARSGRYAAIVAAGFVVDGGIYRHDFVAETVIRALMQVQLETETPVFSVVLTPHHFHEHDIHQRFFHGHFRLKGAEAARACHGTLQSLARIAEAG